MRTSRCLPNSSGRNCRKARCTVHSSRQLMCQSSRAPSRAPSLPAVVCSVREGAVTLLSDAYSKCTLFSLLKWSHMKQPELRDCSYGCHMPQEPLKLFKWYHISASEGTQAVQQCLGTIVREACRHTHPSLTPTGRDFRCVRSKRSVGTYPAERLLLSPSDLPERQTVVLCSSQRDQRG